MYEFAMTKFKNGSSDSKSYYNIVIISRRLLNLFHLQHADTGCPTKRKHLKNFTY